MAKKFVVWFDSVDREDGSIVGGKGANLGEMTKAGFPVPEGFIVTAQAYFHFLDEAKLREKIRSALTDLNISDNKALEEAANKVQHFIVNSRFPADIAKMILDAYFTMDEGLAKHAIVAVRSSATAEDLPGASFAGQQSTFLNVKGESNVIEKVKEAWASLFTARAIFYRQTNHFDHFKVGIAVPVQRMVESEKSGIMFTIDPVTNDKKKIMIEAIFGLGEMIVQGAVTPDHYEVNKKEWKIVDVQLGTQEKMMIRKGNGNTIVNLTSVKGHKQKLTHEEIFAVAKLGKDLEKHYYYPQDIEWAIEKGKVYIVQTRPVTTVGKEVTDAKKSSNNIKKQILLTGDPASPGMAVGPAKLLSSPKQISKILPGDVLVAEQTNPDFVPAMKKAVAIITERGGRTSHAAIVSRELGIPAVVGADNAMKKLKDNDIVTVNGSAGLVYKGSAMTQEELVKQHETKQADYIKTATKVYVNLAEPTRAEKVAALNADGVGLLRAEFMIADIGTHPKKLIEEHKEKIFIQTLAEQIEIFCKAFSPRPVIYRATDFKTNEYKNLKGGAKYEPEEPNPMLGFRGAARYVADSRVFEMEIQAMKMVRNKMGYKNLHLMIPFVRNPKELSEVKKLVGGWGLTRSSTFKLWLMVEIPTNVIRLDDFLDIGVDGVSIGSNDLTMLMLGTDRDNSEVAHDFSELDPTLLWAFQRVAEICGKRGVTTSMCGQAPSDYPDLVHKLVQWGFTSMSVNPDAIDHVRATIADAEKSLGKKK